MNLILASGICLGLPDDWAREDAGGMRVTITDVCFTGDEDLSYSIYVAEREILTGLSKLDVQQIILMIATILRLKDSWQQRRSTGVRVTVEEDPYNY